MSDRCETCGAATMHDGPPICYGCAHKDDGPGVSSEAAEQDAVTVSGERGRLKHEHGSRIPPEALAAVERVLAHRAAAVAEVPGHERWRQTTIDHQTAKALSHAAEAALGTTEDRDTGEHPLAHAAARALLGLALYEMERSK